MPNRNNRSVHINENKLRAEVAKRRKQLKRSENGEIHEQTWSFMEEMGWLHDATEMFDEEAVEYVVRMLDRLDEVAPGSYARRMASRDPGGEHDEEDDRQERYFEVKLGTTRRNARRPLRKLWPGTLRTTKTPKGIKRSSTSVAISLEALF